MSTASSAAASRGPSAAAGSAARRARRARRGAVDRPARAAAAALGLFVDRVVGDPPNAAHPVAWFGSAMARFERGAYADDRLRGVGHAAAGTALGVLGGTLVPSTAATTAVAAGGRSLGAVADQIGRTLQAGDVAGARRLLPSLVGRDPSLLDEAGIARAVVESVAENTVDAIVAPALWAAVGGPRAVLAHRAINTMDAMVGYRDDRYGAYGWAAARLDDVVAWVPARVTAALVVAVRPAAAGAVVAAVRRDAPAHPSPNSGVAEAAFAAALGVQLGGTNRYGEVVEHRPLLGRGRAPAGADITAAVRLSRDVTTALALALAAPWALRGAGRMWARRSGGVRPADGAGGPGGAGRSGGGSTGRRPAR